jgi:hypothetical protein
VGNNDLRPHLFTETASFAVGLKRKQIAKN